MHYAEAGDRVRVACRWIWLANEDETTREFTVGETDSQAWLSLTVVGMAQGDKRRISVPANDSHFGGHPLGEPMGKHAIVPDSDGCLLELTLISLDRSPHANASRRQFDLGGEG